MTNLRDAQEQGQVQQIDCSHIIFHPYLEIGAIAHVQEGDKEVDAVEREYMIDPRQHIL